jgi:hypothetical protein
MKIELPAKCYLQGPPLGRPLVHPANWGGPVNILLIRAGLLLPSPFQSSITGSVS